jgi:protein phosphatase 2C family protein 2/3
MTLLVVGITHGRTKEGWYEWIKERVKNEYGYKTRDTPPRLYAESRLSTFRARREAQEAREKMKAAA